MASKIKEMEKTRMPCNPNENYLNFDFNVVFFLSRHTHYENKTHFFPFHSNAFFEVKRFFACFFSLRKNFAYMQESYAYLVHVLSAACRSFSSFILFFITFIALGAIILH